MEIGNVEWIQGDVEAGIEESREMEMGREIAAGCITRSHDVRISLRAMGHSSDHQMACAPVAGGRVNASIIVGGREHDDPDIATTA